MISIGSIIVCAVIALIVAFIGTGALRAELKSVKLQEAAAIYEQEGSFTITSKDERYLYKKIEKTPKPKKND